MHDTMTGADIFRSRLRSDERVLWNAPASAAVRDAAYRRSQRTTLVWSLVCVGLSVPLAWFAYDEGRDLLAKPNILSIFDMLKLALFAALALGIGALGVRFWLQDSARRRLWSDWHRHYVLTDQRVFYVDETGDLIDEVEGREIVAVILDEDVTPPAVLVERRTGDEEDKHLILMDLEQPFVAKAKITETFLEPAS